ncbi:MAG: SRPBCC family protein [Acidimicrobiia bacterium]|nr:SRPBCC family protein [Acidimicrobiia bacterium]
MNVDATITIARPVDEVFAYVTDVTNMPHWVTGVSRARMVSDAMGAGARFMCQYTSALRPNEIELEVTTYQAPTAIGLAASRGPLNFEGTMTLTEVDGGTSVTNTIVADPDSLATRLASLLFGWLVRPSYRKRLARELEALRTAMSGEKAATE